MKQKNMLRGILVVSAAILIVGIAGILKLDSWYQQEQFERNWLKELSRRVSADVSKIEIIGGPCRGTTCVDAASLRYISKLVHRADDRRSANANGLIYEVQIL